MILLSAGRASFSGDSGRPTSPLRAGSRLAARSVRPPRMGGPTLASIMAHLLAAGLLLLGSIVLPEPKLAPPLEPATVEMVLKAPGVDGPPQSAKGHNATTAAPPPTAPPPAPPAPKPAPAPVPSPPPAPPPPPDQAEPVAATPPPATPEQPTPVQAPPPSPATQLPPGPPSPPAPAPTPEATRPTEAAPAVRLGEAGPPGLTDDISGDIPASPDPSAPNLPPRYPREAVRRGQQGTVILMVMVAPTGEASSVTVTGSSGFPMLDQAAEQAVSRWRFKPERDNTGAPVSSQMPIRIRFLLD